jgi:F0F1-type ATP synthase epsilon subunit
MLVSIYTLQDNPHRIEAQSVTCKTAVGEITILDNHRPYITFLTPGPIRVIDIDGKDDTINSANAGLLEVLPGSIVNILVREL